MGEGEEMGGSRGPQTLLCGDVISLEWEPVQAHDCPRTDARSPTQPGTGIALRLPVFPSRTPGLTAPSGHSQLARGVPAAPPGSRSEEKVVRANGGPRCQLEMGRWGRPPRQGGETRDPEAGRASCCRGPGASGPTAQPHWPFFAFHPTQSQQFLCCSHSLQI